MALWKEVQLRIRLGWQTVRGKGEERQRKQGLQPGGRTDGSRHREAENGVLARHPSDCVRQGSDMGKWDSEGQSTCNVSEKQTPWQKLWRQCPNLRKCLLLEKLAFLPLRDSWQCLEVFLFVRAWVGRMLPASSWQRPGMPLNTLIMHRAASTNKCPCYQGWETSLWRITWEKAIRNKE